MTELLSPVFQSVDTKLLNPAMLLTATRAISSVPMARYLARGQGTKYATVLTGLLALTDAEGKVARAIEKRWPNSGYGESEFGKKADPVADTMFGAGIATGVLLSKHTTTSAKLASAIVLTKATDQAWWAMQADHKHVMHFDSHFEPNVSMLGKIGTVLTLSGLGLAVATSDLDGAEYTRLRKAAGVASIGLAVAGFACGKIAQRGYQAKLDADVNDHMERQRHSIIPITY